ncbi:M14 family zinc carboxypeptidase [Cytobacillus sp. S13-E01]|nr:M14 family zinc carboxypeptidase [Cytobacillus sp. S13-E01]
MMKKLIFCLNFLLLFVYQTESIGAAIVNPDQVYTYDQMMMDIKSLTRHYPEELEVKIIGRSTLGKEIPAIKLGKGEKNILFIGSHHGREWLTTNLLMKMLDAYTPAYKKGGTLFEYDVSVLDKVSIWFVPMLNPDGVTIQQQGIDKFPIVYKELLLDMNENDLNFKKWKANGIGIDLNRQYPAGWNEIEGDSDNVSYQFYKGNKPLEAKETDAMVRFTYEIDPSIAIAYHSSGRVLYWYYKNKSEFVNRDKKIAQKFSKMTGYELAEPPKHAVGGGYTDWFISEFNRPAFTAEISFQVNETSPPLYVLAEEWKRNRAIGLMMATEAVKLEK